MEPVDSMLHSQGPFNNSCPEPNQPNSSYGYLFKVHSNIVLPSTPRPSNNNNNIRGFNFAQRSIFFGFSSFNDLKSQTLDPRHKVPPGGLLLRIFRSRKYPLTSAGNKPPTLGTDNNAWKIINQ